MLQFQAPNPAASERAGWGQGKEDSAGGSVTSKFQKPRDIQRQKKRRQDSQAEPQWREQMRTVCQGSLY